MSYFVFFVGYLCVGCSGSITSVGRLGKRELSCLLLFICNSNTALSFLPLNL